MPPATGANRRRFPLLSSFHVSSLFSFHLLCKMLLYILCLLVWLVGLAGKCGWVGVLMRLIDFLGSLVYSTPLLVSSCSLVCFGVSLDGGISRDLHLWLIIEYSAVNFSKKHPPLPFPPPIHPSIQLLRSRWPIPRRCTRQRCPSRKTP